MNPSTCFRTLLMSLSVVATGCGQGKVNQCNSLIEVINKGAKNFDASKPADASGLKQVADSMDRMANDAAQVKLAVPELQKFSTDYQNMTREAAKSAREMAAAFEAKDVQRADAAQAALEKAVKQEDSIVEGINTFCQAP